MSTFVSMIANAKGTFRCGYDEYWKVWSKEILLLAEGNIYDY